MKLRALVDRGSGNRYRRTRRHFDFRNSAQTKNSRMAGEVEELRIPRGEWASAV